MLLTDEETLFLGFVLEDQHKKLAQMMEGKIPQEPEWQQLNNFKLNTESILKKMEEDYNAREGGVPDGSGVDTHTPHKRSKRTRR